MDTKYNVGEPVALYAWVHRIVATEDGLLYDLHIKDGDGKYIQTVYGVTEEDFTTVF